MDVAKKPQPVSDYKEVAKGGQKWLGHLAMLLFAILISGSFSIGHLAVQHITPAALNAIRFMIASIVMGVMVIAIYGRAPRAPPSFWGVAILGVLMATYFVLMFNTLRVASPVSSAAVFTLIPIMSAIFGRMFLGQVIRSTVAASLLIAGAGSIWMIFRGSIDAILSFDVGSAELMFIIGCAGHAAYAPLTRKFNPGMPIVEFTFWTLMATTFFISVYGVADIISTPWLALPSIVWSAIAYLSIVTTAITLFLVQFASMRLHSAKVLSYGYLTPGVIILIEGLLGHGWATLSVGLGALATIAGLIFLAISPDN